MRNGRRAQHALDRHLARGEISEEEFRAGDRLRRAIERVASAGPGVIDPTRLRTGERPSDLGGEAVEAWDEAQRAFEQLGPELGEIVRAVCVEGESARTVSGQWGAPDKAAIWFLRLALRGLRRFYAKGA